MYKERYQKCDRTSTPSAASCTTRERRTAKRLEARLEAYAYRRYLDGAPLGVPGLRSPVSIGAGPRILPPMELRVGANVVIGLCERCGPVAVDRAFDDVSHRVGEPVVPGRIRAIRSRIATPEGNVTAFRRD